MKKFLSCILVLVFLTITLGSVFAVTSAQFKVSSIEAKAGETVNINIDIIGNPGIASIKLDIEYDSDLILNSIQYNTALGGQSQQPQTLTSPVTLNWFNGSADTTGDMTYATLNFTVKAGATAGDKNITVTYNPDDVYNSNLDNIDFAVINGKITIPSETTDAPVETTDAPAETTDAPAETTDSPAETTDAPVETTDAPAETTDAPAETTDAPVETTDAPVETTDAPAETTDAPAETTDAPAETTDAPAETTDAPVETTDAPVETTDAPVEAPENPKTGAGTSPIILIITGIIALGIASACASFIIRKKRLENN